MASVSTSKSKTAPADGSVPSLVPLGVLAGKPTIVLGRPVTSVGARKTNRLHLISRTVSQLHALLINSGGGTYVLDLASREGVLVNDSPVKNQQLHTGDRVQFGKFLFEYRGPKNARKIVDRDPAPASLQADDGPATPIDDKTLLIGRRENVDLAFADDASVSSLHAIVFPIDGRWYIRDLGSRTGTMLNGKPIHQEKIKFGDKLQIGNAMLRLASAEATESDAEPAADEAVSSLDSLAVEPHEEPSPLPVDDMGLDLDEKVPADESLVEPHSTPEVPAPLDDLSLPLEEDAPAEPRRSWRSELAKDPVPADSVEADKLDLLDLVDETPAIPDVHEPEPETHEDHDALAVARAADSSTEEPLDLLTPNLSSTTEEETPALDFSPESAASEPEESSPDLADLADLFKSSKAELEVPEADLLELVDESPLELHHSDLVEEPVGEPELSLDDQAAVDVAHAKVEPELTLDDNLTIDDLADSEPPVYVLDSAKPDAIEEISLEDDSTAAPVELEPDIEINDLNLEEEPALSLEDEPSAHILDSAKPDVVTKLPQAPERPAIIEDLEPLEESLDLPDFSPEPAKTELHGTANLSIDPFADDSTTHTLSNESATDSAEEIDFAPEIIEAEPTDSADIEVLDHTDPTPESALELETDPALESTPELPKSQNILSDTTFGRAVEEFVGPSTGPIVESPRSPADDHPMATLEAEHPTTPLEITDLDDSEEFVAVPEDVPIESSDFSLDLDEPASVEDELILEEPLKHVVPDFAPKPAPAKPTQITAAPVKKIIDPEIEPAVVDSLEGEVLDTLPEKAPPPESFAPESAHPHSEPAAEIVAAEIEQPITEALEADSLDALPESSPPLELIEPETPQQESEPVAEFSEPEIEERPADPQATGAAVEITGSQPAAAPTNEPTAEKISPPTPTLTATPPTPQSHVAATPPQPEEPAAPTSSKSTPSVFGFNFEGNSFIGGLPLKLKNAPAEKTPEPKSPAVPTNLTAVPPPPQSIAPSTAPPATPRRSPPGAFEKEIRTAAPQSFGGIAPVIRPPAHHRPVGPPPPYGPNVNKSAPPNRPATPPPPASQQPAAITTLVDDMTVPPLARPTRQAAPTRKALSTAFDGIGGHDVFAQGGAPISASLLAAAQSDIERSPAPQSFGAPIKFKNAPASNEIPPTAAATAPARQPASAPSKLRVPILLALMIVLIAGTWAAVYMYFPHFAKVTGQLAYTNLNQLPIVDQEIFERTQILRLGSGDVRNIAKSIVTAQSISPGFLDDPMRFEDAISKTGKTQFVGQDLVIECQTSEKDGKAQVSALLTALAQKNADLTDAQARAAMAADTARHQVEKARDHVDEINSQIDSLKTAGDQRPDPTDLTKQESDAARLTKLSEDAKASRVETQLAWESLRQTDTSKPIDLETDSQMQQLRKQVIDLNEQIAQLKAPSGTASPSDSNAELIKQLQAQVETLQSKMNQREAVIQADQKFTPEQRDSNRQKAVEDLTIKLAKLQSAESDAFAAANTATARAKQTRQKLEAAQLAAARMDELPRQKDAAEAELSAKSADQADKQAALAKCVVPATEPRVSVEPMTDQRPAVAGIASGVIFLIFGYMIILATRNPSKIVVPAPVSPLPWPKHQAPPDGMDTIATEGTTPTTQQDEEILPV